MWTQTRGKWFVNVCLSPPRVPNVGDWDPRKGVVRMFPLPWGDELQCEQVRYVHLITSSLIIKSAEFLFRKIVNNQSSWIQQWRALIAFHRHFHFRCSSSILFLTQFQQQRHIKLRKLKKVTPDKARGILCKCSCEGRCLNKEDVLSGAGATRVWDEVCRYIKDRGSTWPALSQCKSQGWFRIFILK